MLIVSTMTSECVVENVFINLNALRVSGSSKTYGLKYLCHDLKCVGTVKVMDSLGLMSVL